MPESGGNDGMWKALRSSPKPWKSLLRFPHFHRTATATLTLKPTQKGGTPQLTALPRFQAHPSIRKDSFSACMCLGVLVTVTIKGGSALKIIFYAAKSAIPFSRS